MIQINDLMAIQDTLDTRIFSTHNTSREATKRDRILALLVELGECANETKTFKYWSLSKPSPKEIIAEELSDVVHFMFSLGIDCGLKTTHIEIKESSLSLSELFLHAYKLVTSLLADFSQETLINIYETVFTIATKLHISPENIRQEYLKKNEKNHERQDNNY